jgi:hypothetical protein
MISEIFKLADKFYFDDFDGAMFMVLVGCFALDYFYPTDEMILRQ